MKIRSKLTLRYVGATAIIFSLFVLVTYLFSEKNREKEFFADLKKEAVTKTNLFLENKVDAEVMHSIYMNNREFIDEVEVAIYDLSFRLLYHDASEIDLVKETPEMLQNIVDNNIIDFYQNDYQVIGMVYPFQGKEYIITAIAYDGYGYSKLDGLTRILLISWIIGIMLLAFIGYMLARGALSPVARIVDEVEAITESNLHTRLATKGSMDELGELATTFNDMLNRLEKSFDTQKMFVSNVSHELRTPMSALITELELALLKNRTEEEYKQVITQALEDARRMEKLSSGLLDLAKASYDPQQISMRPVRLDELLLDARELVMKANKKYFVNILFEQEIEDENVITVPGNEYLLKIAFTNLIENNCKFSDNNTSNIHISYYNENTILRFSDTGIGISEKDINNILLPFERGENKTYTQGNGIGMTLVQKILMLHRGSIEINSHKGEGTVFVVKLPHV